MNYDSPKHLSHVIIGRDLCQVRLYWYSQEGHPRPQWSLVWWKTGLGSIHIRRNYAGPPVVFPHASFNPSPKFQFATYQTWNRLQIRLLDFIIFLDVSALCVMQILHLFSTAGKIQLYDCTGRFHYWCSLAFFSRPFPQITFICVRLPQNENEMPQFATKLDIGFF